MAIEHMLDNNGTQVNRSCTQGRDIWWSRGGSVTSNIIEEMLRYYVHAQIGHLSVSEGGKDRSKKSFLDSHRNFRLCR